MAEARRMRPRHVVLILGLMVLMLLMTGCAEKVSPQAWFGRPQTDFARILQDLFDRIILIATIVFIVVEAILFLALFRFRRRPGQGMPAQFHGNTNLEIGWTIAPAIMLVFVFIREPAIDNMTRRMPRERGLRATIWEAITAHSHHPDYPAEIAVDAGEEGSS